MSITDCIFFGFLPSALDFLRKKLYNKFTKILETERKLL